MREGRGTLHRLGMTTEAERADEQSKLAQAEAHGVVLEGRLKAIEAAEAAGRAEAAWEDARSRDVEGVVIPKDVAVPAALPRLELRLRDGAAAGGGAVGAAPLRARMALSCSWERS